MQHRRVFIDAMLAGASLQEAATAVGIAMAKNGKYVYAKTASKDDNRFCKFICLQLEVLQIVQQMKDLEKRQLYARLKTVQARFFAKSDEMLAYAMEAFPVSSYDDRVKDRALLQQVNDLFEKRMAIDTLVERELRAAEDAIIVISMAKNMITKYRVPWDTMKMTQFLPFALKYRRLIMGED